MSMVGKWEWEQKGRHITDENHCQSYCSTAATVLSNMVANISGQFNRSLLNSFLLPSKIEGRIKKHLWSSSTSDMARKRKWVNLFYPLNVERFWGLLAPNVRPEGIERKGWERNNSSWVTCFLHAEYRSLARGTMWASLAWFCWFMAVAPGRGKRPAGRKNQLEESQSGLLKNSETLPVKQRSYLWKSMWMLMSPRAELMRSTEAMSRWIRLDRKSVV